MMDFTYYAPTKVYFGRGVERKAAGFLRDEGAGKVLVLFGGGSVERSGLLGKIREDLEEAGLEYVLLGGVEPNPKVGFVREAAQVCIDENIDYILAVGGGSVIDTAKCASFSAACGADPWDIITMKVPADRRIPVAVVLTIAAAGSEMSNSEVITNPDIMVKQGLTTDFSRPVAAFMDPELTFTVSKYQTGCGIVDIMMHTMERYYTSGDSGTELTDRMAQALLLSVKEAGRAAIEDPEDYNARATLMWASSLSHNGLMNCGKNYSGLVVHKLEHGLSGVFDSVAHGAGLAVLYPAWAKYVYKHDIGRFSSMAYNVWGVPEDREPEDAAALGVEAMRDYFASIGMPVTLGELEVYPDSFEKVADVITAGGTKAIQSYVPLDKKRIIEIFEIAK